MWGVTSMEMRTVQLPCCLALGTWVCLREHCPSPWCDQVASVTGWWHTGARFICDQRTTHSHSAPEKQSKVQQAVVGRVGGSKSRWPRVAWLWSMPVDSVDTVYMGPGHPPLLYCPHTSEQFSVSDQLSHWTHVNTNSSQHDLVTLLHTDFVIVYQEL